MRETTDTQRLHVDITVVLGGRMRDSDESSDVYLDFFFFLESLNASIEK